MIQLYVHIHNKIVQDFPEKVTSLVLEYSVGWCNINIFEIFFYH